jgi:Zn-dependent peptidase ImmA (M78 family)
MIVRRKYIRAIAEKLLARSKATPPIPVEAIARDLSLQVSKRKVENTVSGFLLRNGDGSAVIGVNEAHSLNRQRFTVAHELGHFLLHGGDVSIHVDDRVKLRDPRSAEGTDVQEIESNLFAAELLMPVSFLREDLKRFGMLDMLDEHAIDLLAKRYGVSNHAMAIRLSSLGCVAI